MTTQTPSQAGARLDQLVFWAKATFISVTVSGAILFHAVAFAAYKYWQVTSAISEVQDNFRRELAKFPRN